MTQKKDCWLTAFSSVFLLASKMIFSAGTFLLRLRETATLMEPGETSGWRVKGRFLRMGELPRKGFWFLRQPSSKLCDNNSLLPIFSAWSLSVCLSFRLIVELVLFWWAFVRNILSLRCRSFMSQWQGKWWEMLDTLFLWLRHLSWSDTMMTDLHMINTLLNNMQDAKTALDWSGSSSLLLNPTKLRAEVPLQLRVCLLSIYHKEITNSIFIFFLFFFFF